MRSSRKKYEPSDWRFTMDQIGRELRKTYQRPARLSRRLHALLARVEGKPTAVGSLTKRREIKRDRD